MKQECSENDLDLYAPYPFSKSEYRERLNQARAEMRRKKIDVLILSAPESLYYISGYALRFYEAQSPKEWMQVACIAIEADHNDFIFFDGEKGVVEPSTVTKDARYNYETQMPSDKYKNPRTIAWIAEELKKEEWLPGTVGLEMWSYRPNRIVSDIFQKELEKKGGRVVDGSDIVRDLRWIKSPQELAYIEKAAKICDIGMKRAIEIIKPGMTELELQREIDCAMAKAGGEVAAIPDGVRARAPNEGGGHYLSSRRKIKPGDSVGVDMCGVYNRYHYNIARHFSIGKPKPDEAKRNEILLSKGFEYLRDAVRPNMPITELNKATIDFYKKHRQDMSGKFLGGYELGISFPPDWCGPGYYSINVNPGDRLFIPGVVVNNESWGINTIVFYKDRARSLSEIPNDLIIV